MNNQLDKNISYQQMLLQVLQRNEEQTKIWTKYKKDHESISQGLQVIPLELSINCLVPIGNHAFVKGKLKHTNEILACLGEGYFAKYSAAQAIELCNSRIKRAEEVLENLKKERDLFELRQMFCLNNDELFGHDVQGEELIEHWNEEDLEKWRVEHRKKEKEYHEKKKKKALESSNEKEIESSEKHSKIEEELFKRLDELEYEEEMLDEYYRSLENDGDHDDDDDDDDDDSNRQHGEEKVDERTIKEKKAMIIIENIEEEHEKSNSEVENFASKNSTLQKPQKNLSSRDKNKRVYFSDIEKGNSDPCEYPVLATFTKQQNESDDDDDDVTVVINITHSDISPNYNDDGGNVINSPRDVYSRFYKPKSILRRTQDNVNNVESISTSSSRDEFNFRENIPRSIVSDKVMKDIRESNPEEVQTASLGMQKKPLSRFKKERAKLRK